MTIIGYARTSTKEQNYGLADQIDELRRYGCEDQNLYAEQVSSVAQALPELDKALTACQVGDVFVITKPDRLARKVIKLLSTIESLTDRGVHVVILSFSGERLDTRSPQGKAMLGMMAVMAEFERDSMLVRQRAGIEAAKAEGKFIGRPRPTRAADIIALRREGLPRKEIALRLGVHLSAVDRALSKAGSQVVATGSELSRAA